MERSRGNRRQNTCERTPYLGPAVPLCLVLVVGVASLQHGLLRAATASHLTNHRAACAGDHLYPRPCQSQHYLGAVTFLSVCLNTWQNASERDWPLLKALSEVQIIAAKENTCVAGRRQYSYSSSTDLLGAGRQLDASDACLGVVCHNNGIVA